MRCISNTVLSLLMLISAGCGDANVVLSTGSVVIVYTTYSAARKVIPVQATNTFTGN